MFFPRSSTRIAAQMARAALVGLAVLAIAAPAEAKKKQKVKHREPEPTLSGRAAVAVVAIKDQRVALYDAAGGVVRARISTGQTGRETPVGVFSVLEKEVEHYSNLYDDASMPYMQRITWSGIALHAGRLPGYPASHGCIRMPYAFAKRIFSMTKVGLRVVISRDDIAPVGISHPLLFQPEPLSETAMAIPAAYGNDEADVNDERITMMQPDVKKWPARQALLESLEEEAEVKAEAAKEAVAKWTQLKANLNKHRKEVALVAKRESAEKTKTKAVKALAAAQKRLAEADTKREKNRAERRLADAEKWLRRTESRYNDAARAAIKADQTVSRLKFQITRAETEKTAAVAAAAEAKRKTLPVSVFVSRKTGKLYVRQGNEPVFDTEIAIRDPDRPIGTHVFTALDFANEGNDVRWNVVSISRRSAGDDWEFDRYNRKSKKKNSAYAPPETDAGTAAAALERIAIPESVRKRFSEYVWPGSSLIISDEAKSKETGKNTDFVIVASNEPQGALKKRKREPSNKYRDFYADEYYNNYQSPYPPNQRYRKRMPASKGIFGFW